MRSKTMVSPKQAEVGGAKEAKPSAGLGSDTAVSARHAGALSTTSSLAKSSKVGVAKAGITFAGITLLGD